MGTEASRPAPAELEPWEAVVDRALDLLADQVADLRQRSPFVASQLDRAGVGPDFRPNSLDELRAVPLCDKQDIRSSLAAAPPFGNHLAVPPAEVVQVQATSGTTGSPSYIGLTHADLDTWAELGRRAFVAGGLRGDDRVLHAWSLSKGFAGGVPVVGMLHHLGATVLPLGAEAGVDRLLVVARDLGATAICTTPNFALYLGEQAERALGAPAAELPVRALVVGGEPGGGIPAIRQRIEATWEATCREVLGNSDIATMIWAECEVGDGMHFIGQDLVLAELIDPATGAHVEPATGATGEIVYTALRRRASPLLRFRSGDLVEVRGTECPCGRTSFRLRCQGRTDDMLLVRGVNVWPSAVQEVVVEHRPRVTGALRIVADFPGASTQRPLRILVERASPEVDREQLAEALAKALRSRLAFSASVEVVEAGTIDAPGAAKVRLVERTEPTDVADPAARLPSASGGDGGR